MGTEKYPIENDYTEYLSKHSGSRNANAGNTSTSYWFEMAADRDAESSSFYGALDRFAQFFICPLFPSSALDRELKAVHSEHIGHLADDGLRFGQLSRSTSNPNHPWSYLDNGTFDTLKTAPEARGLNVRDALIGFYEGKYSANLMKLVILGPQPLNVLEKLAVDLFAHVPNKNLPHDHWETEVPLRPDDLLTQCFAKPNSDWQWIDVELPFLDETQRFESQPSRYITHLVGHKGPGSIFFNLYSKGWAVNVSALVRKICPNTPGMLVLRIHLTENGLEHYREIVKVFFHYACLLRKTPPQEWIFNEIKTLADFAFKFMQKTTASEFTQEISSVMQTPIPKDQLLRGPSR
jgi:insulysin